MPWGYEISRSMNVIKLQLINCIMQVFMLETLKMAYRGNIYFSITLYVFYVSNDFKYLCCIHLLIIQSFQLQQQVSVTIFSMKS